MVEKRPKATQSYVPSPPKKELGKDIGVQADLDDPRLTRYEMQLEKIIRSLWTPLIKKYTKEYALSQLVPRHQKEMVLKIIKDVDRRGRSGRRSKSLTTKEEFMLKQTPEGSVEIPEVIKDLEIEPVNNKEKTPN